MVDTHCHIDMYDDPLKVARECEEKGIITIGMTSLPSHFEVGYQHLLTFKKVRLALGMHPLFAEEHSKEFQMFCENLWRTSYVGEIGLDFSVEGLPTKEIQLDSFKKILAILAPQKKIISLHSRRAEKAVLEELIRYNIENAIFHWYTGPGSLVEQILNHGCFFSINTAMIASKNGQAIIKRIPLNRILTETDGPFIKKNGRPVKPDDVSLVESYLSKIHGLSHPSVSKQIKDNFLGMIKDISHS
ncbi:MAG: TatD family hydrolase [Sphingobacteriaceae bacterium]|nr:TatD family hydrolase [Sphingobacteriaceae bacterium]